MKRRKSYFVNFPTNSLFLVLEQNLKQLNDLEQKLAIKNNQLLKERIKQVELVVAVSKNVIIERYLEAKISLTKIAHLLTTSEGIKESVYKELFTLKVLESDDIISIDLLTEAIDKLDISELMMIIRKKPNTVYANVALEKWDEIIFDVEPEVYEEYVLKKKLDGKRNW